MGTDNAASGEDGAKVHMRESELLRLAMDWLAAKHILAFRMNVGAVKTEQRFFRFGVSGMADILAFPRDITSTGGYGCIRPTWVELKVGTNNQSDLQKSFQQQVEQEGHRYILARSLADVEEAFR
jgi:hypothetical protein